MAIDSAEKRRSVAGIWIWLLPGVTPNAAADQEWRQEAGWSYSGILAAGPVVVVDRLPNVAVPVMDDVAVDLDYQR